jgi:N-acetylmuramic acid 6-phosphate etherase
MEGQRAMNEPFSTEAVHPEGVRLDAASTVDLVRAINENDRGVPAVVGTQADPIAWAVDEVARRLRAGGALHYFGAGTSGRLAALDAAECPPTFGVGPQVVRAHLAGGESAMTHAAEAAEDDLDAGRAEAVAAVRPGDAVVGVAASGATPYVQGAIAAAREKGAFTAVVVCVPRSPLAAMAEIAIELVVGPEIVAGSTRLKAGTAQKLALNTLSTAVFWRLGHVYQGRMVDVVPSNAKLRRRAARTVAELTGRDMDDATAALERCGGVKLAVLVLRTGLDPEAARARLDAAGGDLARALSE